MLTENQVNFLNSLSPEKLNSIVKIERWDPKGIDIADDIIAEIKQVQLELRPILTGSVAFKIPGERDLDLSIYCPKIEQARYVPALTNLFGKHLNEGKSHIGWEFIREGFHVTVYLTDPASPNSKVQKDFFELLTSRPDLVKEYEQIKLAQEGKTYKEYQTAKYEFFNRVLGL